MRLGGKIHDGIKAARGDFLNGAAVADIALDEMISRDLSLIIGAVSQVFRVRYGVKIDHVIRGAFRQYRAYEMRSDETQAARHQKPHATCSGNTLR